MKYFRINNLCLFCLTVAAFVIFISPAQARRIRVISYPLEVLKVEGGEIISRKSDFRYSFPFPVSVSSHHVSAYLWLKDMIVKGNLPQGLPLVYLDAHSDYWGHRSKMNSANWVRFVLGEELCSRAILLLPEWAVKEREFFRIHLASSKKISNALIYSA